MIYFIVAFIIGVWALGVIAVMHFCPEPTKEDFDREFERHKL